MIYLDYSANTPVDEAVLERFCAVERSCPGNANSRHQAGAAAKTAIDEATQSIARKMCIRDRCSPPCRMVRCAPLCRWNRSITAREVSASLSPYSTWVGICHCRGCSRTQHRYGHKDALTSRCV